MKLFNPETDKTDLINLFCHNIWKFHTNKSLPQKQIENEIEEGYYSDNRETLWIIINEKKVGILIIDDIDDSIPIFDLRLYEKEQGNGIGMEVLKWLQNYLFGEKQKLRVEGYTRRDNIAMRKCFSKSGFVKEGYLRKAWESADDRVFDTVLYAAISEDWINNTITPVNFNDVDF